MPLMPEFCRWGGNLAAIWRHERGMSGMLKGNHAAVSGITPA